MDAVALQQELEALADPAIAAHSARFFKTGPGEYGEGDRFLGIRVPTLRKLARRGRGLPPGDAETLLSSPFHEARLLALLIWVEQCRRGDAAVRRDIYRRYLANTHHINNWDLVDSSAEHLVGAWLLERDRAPLYKLARATDLWKRRIAVMATFHFIKHDDFGTTLDLAERLLEDDHDLIHKAVGWMLREVWKRAPETLERFLRKHYRQMPRTMLRYAIERLEPSHRRAYLQGQV